MILKRGDIVIATYGDKTVDAMVTLASPNGKSLIIMFEAMLGGHVGVMPVLMHDDGRFESLLEGRPISLMLKTEAVQ